MIIVAICVEALNTLKAKWILSEAKETISFEIVENALKEIGE